MRKPDISFCMIVRNGGRSLAACLKSVAPLVDEMIVLDTGSTDGSPAVAASLGARVVSATWPGDFASARNSCLKLARGAWVLSLDADEELGAVDKSTLLEHLQRHSDSAFVFTIRNYFFMSRTPGLMAPAEFAGEVLPGVGYTVSRTVRLFPRRRGIEYCYPVHESLLPALKRRGVSLRRCSVPIHHMGYLYGRNGLAAKASTYRELAYKKLSEHPRYFLAHLELGKILLHDGELDEADRLFDQCLKLNPACSRAYYYLSLTRVHRRQYALALRHLERGLRLTPDHSDMLHLRQEVARRLAQPQTRACSDVLAKPRSCRKSSRLTS